MRFTLIRDITHKRDTVRLIGMVVLKIQGLNMQAYTEVGAEQDTVLPTWSVYLDCLEDLSHSTGVFKDAMELSIYMQGYVAGLVEVGRRR